MNERLLEDAQDLMAIAESKRQEALAAGTVELSEALQAEFEELFSEARDAVLEAKDADPD